jgi:prepilin-type processing-associated H-X9-DG protein
VFAEATPGTDAMRGVLFLDGHVERVPDERWQRLQNVKIMRGTKKVPFAMPSGAPGNFGNLP